VQTRIQIKTCISRYDNVAYIRIQFLRAANYSVGAHSARLHETNCDLDDDDDETTDAGEEVVEAQTADDPQQNPSCMEQVEQQQLSRCPLCRTDNRMVWRLL